MAKLALFISGSFEMPPGSNSNKSVNELGCRSFMASRPIKDDDDKLLPIDAVIITSSSFKRWAIESVFIVWAMCNVESPRPSVDANAEGEKIHTPIITSIIF
ncbi:MAG: hypothetical protein ACRDDZ_07885 [Marinifilaceae bacterium]